MMQSIQLPLFLRIRERGRNCCFYYYCHYDYAVLVSACGPRVNSGHHLATCASVSGRTPQPCISPFLFACRGGVLPKHALECFVCIKLGGIHQPCTMWPGVLPQPCIALPLFCMWPGSTPRPRPRPSCSHVAGCLPNHASCGRGVLPNHAWLLLPWIARIMYSTPRAM